MNKLSILANVLRQNENVEARTGEFDIQCKGVEEIDKAYCEKEFINIFNDNEKDYSTAWREEFSSYSNDFQESHLKNTEKNGAGNKLHYMNRNCGLKNLRPRNNREQTMKQEENYEHEDKYEEMKSGKNELESLEASYKLDKEKEEQGRSKETEQYNKKDSENTELNEDKDWEIAETENGRYYLDFKSPYFTMNERIKIIEAALEDIRERYYDAKDEYNKFNRKCSKMKRKRRATGSK